MKKFLCVVLSLFPSLSGGVYKPKSSFEYVTDKSLKSVPLVSSDEVISVVLSLTDVLLLVAQPVLSTKIKPHIKIFSYYSPLQ